MDREITIVISPDGGLDYVFATRDLEDVNIVLIDKCTNDPTEYEEADRALDESIEADDLVCIYE
jgi:hypothetical protein